MPELSSRTIRKFERNLGGLMPVLDFSNGVRIMDLCIDSSSNTSWRCADNTIGAPKWVMDNFPGMLLVRDNIVSTLMVGPVLSGAHFKIAYTLTGGSIHQSGELKISHNGVDVFVDNEYGGINPAHAIEISGGILDGNIILNLDTTEQVGNDLVMKYTIENKQ